MYWKNHQGLHLKRANIWAQFDITSSFLQPVLLVFVWNWETIPSSFQVGKFGNGYWPGYIARSWHIPGAFGAWRPLKTQLRAIHQPQGHSQFLVGFVPSIGGCRQQKSYPKIPNKTYFQIQYWDVASTLKLAKEFLTWAGYPITHPGWSRLRGTRGDQTWQCDDLGHWHRGLGTHSRYTLQLSILERSCLIFSQSTLLFAKHVNQTAEDNPPLI